MRHRLVKPVSRRAVWTMLAVAVVALFALGGCRFASGLVGEEPPGLGAENGTDITIDLVLNGESLGSIGPGSGMEVASRWRLPALPWEVEARTESGRVLVTMTVSAEELQRNGVKAGGVALPSGRFAMWAGVAAPP
jgi:hypothetical protein